MILSAFLFSPGIARAEETRQVLEDRTFSRGFVLTGPTHQSPLRTETFGQKEVVPLWRIPQWTSRGTLDAVEVTDQTVKFSDPYKSVTLDRESGVINLTVDASKEYDTPRTGPEQPWVHLLLEQSPFTTPIKITGAKAIWVEFDFELTKFKDYGENDPGKHAAQVGWFLYLKNINPKSPGFRDFLWFGMSLFDNRQDFTTLYANQDFAMPDGSFIYTLGSDSYLKEKVEVGRRQKVRIDILPEIRKALETAHSRGFMTKSTIDDLVFDGTNIGWEIPGVFDVGMTFHNLSVEVVE